MSSGVDDALVKPSILHPLLTNYLAAYVIVDKPSLPLLCHVQLFSKGKSLTNATSIYFARIPRVVHGHAGHCRTWRRVCPGLLMLCSGSLPPALLGEPSSTNHPSAEGSRPTFSTV